MYNFPKMDHAIHNKQGVHVKLILEIFEYPQKDTFVCGTKPKIAYSTKKRTSKFGKTNLKLAVSCL